MSRADATPADPRGLLERLLNEAEGNTNPLGNLANPPPPSPTEPPPTATSAPVSPPIPPSDTTQMPLSPPPPPAGAGGTASPVSGVTAPAPLPGGLWGSLLANPALLSALPVLMENLSPLLGGMSPGSDRSAGQGAGQNPEQGLGQSLPQSPGQSPGQSAGQSLGQSAGQSPGQAAGTIPAQAPPGVGGAPTATRPHALDRHTALLCAIKPYLSPPRRDAAETVLRLARVWDALEKSGVSVTGLLHSLGVTQFGHREGGDDRV